MGISVIVKALYRLRSTISKERNKNRVESGRNGWFYRYYPRTIQDLYELRRKECHRKAINDTNVISYIKKFNWTSYLNRL